MTFITILFGCLVGALYSNIADYISLLGSFCTVIVAFLIPSKLFKIIYFIGMLYIKTNDYKIYHYKNILAIIFATVLTGIGFISGSMTIYTMVTGIR